MSTNVNNQQPNSLLETSCAYLESISNCLHQCIQQANMTNWKHVKHIMTEYLNHTSNILEQTIKEYPAPEVPGIEIAHDLFKALAHSIDDLRKMIAESYTLNQLHAALNTFRESTNKLKSHI